MEHKLAHLLRAAADDADARFRCGIGINEVTGDISFVVAHPDWMWQLVEKHDPCAEFKKAYKEGKTIQFRWAPNYDWVTIVREPNWHDATEYRIKPQTETHWLWADENGRVSAHLSRNPYLKFTNKLEWSATEFEVTE